MFNATEFRAIIGGQRRDLRASLWRGLLRAAETPYTAAVQWRNRRYDAAHAATERLSVPVVSVGNLTLGGTGKTPMVEWIARWLTNRGARVAVVSRGYGARPGTLNDEARELAAKLPGVGQFADRHRARAARRAVEEQGCQLILLDDGFQHRRLARDLDVVMVDALEPYGLGHVFPRGTLREPLDAWRRAHVIALSRADLIDAAERASIQAEVRRYAPEAIWLEVAHQPRALLAVNGREMLPESLAGQRVAAFCGIGNPTGFARVLERCGYAVAGLREFPDHHIYGADDLRQLDAWAGALDASAVLCTHKDLVKLDRARIGGKPLWAMTIELRMLVGQDDFEARLSVLADAALSRHAA